MRAKWITESIVLIIQAAQQLKDIVYLSQFWRKSRYWKDEGTPQCQSINFGIICRTVYDIRKNKEKILNLYTSSDCNKGIVNRKTVREVKNADLDTILY